MILVLSVQELALVVRQRPLRTFVAANLLAQNLHRIGRTQRRVVPRLDGGELKMHLVAADRVSPQILRQSFQGRLQRLIHRWRRK